MELLRQDADAHTWVAAAVGSNNAAGYQLATGAPVMPLGGYNGTDPAPTLEQFQRLVAAGRVHWFVGSPGPGGTESGGSDASRQIAGWVVENYPRTTVDGVPLYDLTGAPSLRTASDPQATHSTVTPPGQETPRTSSA